MDLTILIPTYNEEENIGILISKIKQVLEKITKSYEMIVMDGMSQDNTRENAEKAGAKVFIRSSTSFRTFLTEGFPRCKGNYIITIDSDFSHSPLYIRNLWDSRNGADIIICSRYVIGGGAEASLFRIFLSKIFNLVYRFILDIDIQDLNCNYRLYNKKVVRNIKLEGKDFDVLPEVIFRGKLSGYKIKEIPFFYLPRKHGKSKLKLVNYGISYFKTLLNLRKIKIIAEKSLK